MEEQEDKKLKKDKLELNADKKNLEKIKEIIEGIPKIRDFLPLLDPELLLDVALTYLYEENDLREIIDNGLESDVKKKILTDYESEIEENTVQREATTYKQVTGKSKDEINDEIVDQFTKLIFHLERDELIYVALTYFYEEDDLWKLLDNDFILDAKLEYLRRMEERNYFSK